MLASPFLLGLSVIAAKEVGSFRLERAEVLASYEREGECRVVQQMALESAEPIGEARMVHTVALLPGQSLFEVEASAEEGGLATTLTSHGSLTQLAVLARRSTLLSRFEYTLAYSVKGEGRDPYHCPLAVAQAAPRAPHGVVSIELRLPSGRAATAAPFPNLQPRSQGLVGELGAMPAFLRVPFGGSRVPARLSRNALDLAILAFLAFSTAAWWKVRARVGPRE